ncbi:MAG: hypothetical protein KGO93_02120 [Cyanobacteria bacterium REEB446]|nr:hypothetical protein [Cyanobacteria bacterium REEB446]
MSSSSSASGNFDQNSPDPEKFAVLPEEIKKGLSEWFQTEEFKQLPKETRNYFFKRFSQNENKPQQNLETQTFKIEQDISALKEEVEKSKKTLDEKMQESQKRLDEKIRELEQKFEKTLDKKITDQQTQIIALCGIFVAIIAFVTNNVTIFTKADNLYQALVFMVIFFILTAGIILISYQLSRQANNQVDNKDVIGMLILITVITIFLIVFAQNLDHIKLISKQKLTPPHLQQIVLQ